MTRYYWPFYISVCVLVLVGLILNYRSSAPAETRIPSDSQNVESVGQSQVIMPTSHHIPEGQNTTYNTIPPTSGDHWARWAKCGFYEEGLPDELIVHNLEHSIVVISYNLTTEAEVDELRKAVNSIALYRKWGLSRFYDKIPSGTVAMTAWGVLDTVDQIDRDHIERFFNEYASNEGLEQIPCEVDPAQIQV
jgi:hypothetical protein